jgi:hypothetical protein
MIRRSSLRGSGELRLSVIDDHGDKVEDFIRILNYVLVIKYGSEIPLGFEPATEPLGVSSSSDTLLYVPWTERSLFG